MKTKIVISAILLLTGTHLMAMQKMAMQKGVYSYKWRYENSGPYLKLRYKSKKISEKILVWEKRSSTNEKKLFGHLHCGEQNANINCDKLRAKNEIFNVLKQVSDEALQALQKRIEMKKNQGDSPEGDFVVEQLHYHSAWENIGIEKNKVHAWERLMGLTKTVQN